MPRVGAPFEAGHGVGAAPLDAVAIQPPAHQLRRRDPSAAGIEPGRARRAARGLHLCGRPGLQVAGRQAAAIQRGDQRGGLGVLGRQAHEAVAAARHAVRDRARAGRRGGERGRAMRPRVHAVVGMEHAVEQARDVARGRPRGLRVAVEDRAPHALVRKRPGARRAREAAADDGDAPDTASAGARHGLAHRRARLEPGQRDVALAARALAGAPREAGLLQAVAHRAGGAPCGGRRAGRGQPRQGLEDARLPHLRIARRREAVEVEGVDARDEVAQPLDGVAQHQQQFDAAVLERHHVQVGRQRRPGAAQLRGQRGLAGIGQRAPQVCEPQRMLLDRDEAQPLAALRIGAPGRPGGEEVVAQPEARLQHGERVACLPARRQVVAGQEHVRGLRERAVGSVVAIVETRRSRRFGIAEIDLGGDDGVGLHRAIVGGQVLQRARSCIPPRWSGRHEETGGERPGTLQDLTPSGVRA